jgi:hypothetical protein
LDLSGGEIGRETEPEGGFLGENKRFKDERGKGAEKRKKIVIEHLLNISHCTKHSPHVITFNSQSVHH